MGLGYPGKVVLPFTPQYCRPVCGRPHNWISKALFYSTQRVFRKYNFTFEEETNVSATELISSIYKVNGWPGRLYFMHWKSTIVALFPVKPDGYEELNIQYFLIIYSYLIKYIKYKKKILTHF